jgi:hypothetical protein
MKNVSELTANVGEVEICEMPDVRVIGKYTRTNPPSLWEQCFSDGTIGVLEGLPRLIQNAILGFTCDFNPEDGTNGYIVGVITPANTPVPQGFMHKDLPSTIVAKGIFGESMDCTVKRFEELGYTYQIYDLDTGWNAEIYFKDDPNNDTWSNLMPIKRNA